MTWPIIAFLVGMVLVVIATAVDIAVKNHQKRKDEKRYREPYVRIPLLPRDKRRSYIPWQSNARVRAQEKTARAFITRTDGRSGRQPRTKLLCIV